MSQGSADQPFLTADQPVNNSPSHLTLLASIAHQWLTLIGCTFVVFELFFLQLYSDNFWFNLNVIPVGIPAILLCACLAYGALRLCDTKLTYRLASPVCKGQPPIVFRSWVTVEPDGIQYGLRCIQWSVIDELNLTWLGNLQIVSKALSGRTTQKDVVLKIPFGVASQNDQNQLIEVITKKRPDVAINERLEKRLKSPIVKGQNAIQLFGAVMMTAILLDVGMSSTYYLEMLKHYYLADKQALAGDMTAAHKELDEADYLRAHPLPVSYVTPRFLTHGVSASGLNEARAEALWALGKHDDAINDMRCAIDLQPDTFRLYLHLARYLDAQGDYSKAKETIAKAIEHHQDSLLPRMYMVALLRERRTGQAHRYWKQSLQDLDETTFQDQPVWPPGGSRFIHDLFYRDDISYVFERLLKTDTPPSVSTSGTVSGAGPAP